jgi:16S rRNA (uracil1498-N3)-methyltransferase
MDFSQMTARAPQGILRVICRAGAPPITLALKNATSAGVLIICGPEGDFTPEEIAAAEQAGFAPASLGRNRLRTETAAIAALALAAAFVDNLA